MIDLTGRTAPSIEARPKSTLAAVFSAVFRHCWSWLTGATASTRKRRALRVALVVVVVAILVSEVIALAPDIAETATDLAHPRWMWLVVALLAEIGSMVAFARVQRRMLAAGGVRLPLRRAVAMTFAANAVSVTLPAGPVVATGYVFRRMRSWGASLPVVAWSLVASAVVSTMALTAIGAVGAGLVGSEPGSPLDSRDDVVLIAGEVIAIIVLAFAMRIFLRRPELVVRVADAAVRLFDRVFRRKTTHAAEDASGGRTRRLLAELVSIRPRARDWFAGTWFAGANWLLDLLCLVAACRAVGAHGPSLAVALVAYAGGMLASSVPLLPGGLGVVDGALLIALTRGGLPIASATAGVLVYRLISLVFIAAIGWAFWLVLQRHERRMAAA
jgi:putative heme transporter